MKGEYPFLNELVNRLNLLSMYFIIIHNTNVVKNNNIIIVIFKLTFIMSLSQETGMSITEQRLIM